MRTNTTQLRKTLIPSPTFHRNQFNPYGDLYHIVIKLSRLEMYPENTSCWPVAIRKRLKQHLPLYHKFNGVWGKRRHSGIYGRVKKNTLARGPGSKTGLTYRYPLAWRKKYYKTPERFRFPLSDSLIELSP